MLIFLLEASVNATFAFPTVTVQQGLPKHPHMVMQRSCDTGLMLGAQHHPTTQPPKLCSSVRAEHSPVSAPLWVTYPGICCWLLPSFIPSSSFLSAAPSSLTPHLQQLFSSFHAWRFPSVPLMALLAGTWAQGALPVPLATLSQPGFCR